MLITKIVSRSMKSRLSCVLLNWWFWKLLNFTLSSQFRNKVAYLFPNFFVHCSQAHNITLKLGTWHHLFPLLGIRWEDASSFKFSLVSNFLLCPVRNNLSYALTSCLNIIKFKILNFFSFMGVGFNKKCTQLQSFFNSTIFNNH